MRGLTLIEVLISVAILAGALALILQGLVRGAYALEVARNRLRAYAFSTAKMAEVELPHEPSADENAEGAVRMGRTMFGWRLSALPVADNDHLELVTLTVNWQQGQHPYAMQTSMIRRIPAEPQP